MWANLTFDSYRAIAAMLTTALEIWGGKSQFFPGEEVGDEEFFRVTCPDGSELTIGFLCGGYECQNDWRMETPVSTPAVRDMADEMALWLLWTVRNMKL